MTIITFLHVNRPIKSFYLGTDQHRVQAEKFR